MRIYKISNATAKEYEVCYIGDNEAFESFQKYNLSHINEDIIDCKINAIRIPDGLSEKANKEYSNMLDAFYKVIYSSKVNTVGGFTVSVAYENSKFSYIGYYNNTRPPLQPEEIKPNTAISFGNEKIGAYGIQFFGTPKTVALYIVQAKMGISYSDKNGIMQAKYWNRVSQEEFRRELHILDNDIDLSCAVL